jgi:anti-sigma regulatory factor (Ser/Thr protein kinase)
MELADTKRSEVIRRFLLNYIKAKNPHLIHDAMEAFGITRQAVHHHLSELVDKGFLQASGNTRGRVYTLGYNRSQKSVFQLKGLSESDVYYRDFGIVFSDLPKELENICHYGFTEILNNAIDHSGGNEVTIEVERTAESVAISIIDDGEGIFNHIARILKLADPREAILELSKGKLTTDPDNHTGQGIFFTSRAFDEFQIYSGELVFVHSAGAPKDVLLHDDERHCGTDVIMAIRMDSGKTLSAVFDGYTSGEAGDYAFDRTVVPVKLALYEGERLVSRSQAKRILNRVERFKIVMLDFTGVDTIGQAFADEVFRVFARKNPQIQLTPINMSDEVKKMVTAAQSYVG